MTARLLVVVINTLLWQQKSKRLKRGGKKEDYSKYQKKARKERKRKLVEMLGGKCSRCGYNKCIRALDFHHLDSTEKKFNLSTLGYTCSWDRLVEEAQNCELLCANCHREEEADEDDFLIERDVSNCGQCA